MALPASFRRIYSWEGVLLKAVETPEGNASLRVWNGSSWVPPKGATWDDMFKSPFATPEELSRQRVPDE